MGKEAPDQKAFGRLVGLDGLRGIAVFLVLLHHFVELRLPRQIGSWQAYLAASLGLTFSGVDLFFVLSGFLIGGILLDYRTATNLYRVFYLRRTLRILPLYLLFLAVSWTLPGFFSDVEHPTYPPAAYLTFLCNFWMSLSNQWDIAFVGLAWSLAVEEQFYLFFPPIVRRCSLRFLIKVLAGVIVTMPALRIVVLLATPQFSLATHIFTFLRMDTLSLGVLAAIIVREQKTRAWLTENPRALFLIAAAMVPILGILTWARVSVRTLTMAGVGYSALGLFYTAILLIVVRSHPRWVGRICEAAPLVLLGRVSYFVYLFQGIVGWLVFRSFHRPNPHVLASWPDLILTCVTFAFVIGAGILSWKLFESHLVQLGRRFKYELPRNIESGTLVTTHSLAAFSASLPIQTQARHAAKDPSL